jgi:hypothetical protein
MSLFNIFKSKNESASVVVYDRDWIFFEGPENWFIQEDPNQRVFKFMKETQQGRVILSFKSQDVRQGGPLSFDDLFKNDWKAHYSPMITSWEDFKFFETTQKLYEGSLQAVEINGQGSGSTGTIQLWERNCWLNGRVGMLTAIGSPEAFKSVQSEIDKSVETVAFKMAENP